eukprot:28900_1
MSQENEEEKKDNTIHYQYLPSLCSGVYGSYIYNADTSNEMCQKDGLFISCHFVLKKKYNLYISYGTVINATTEVIVNAADEYMLGGDGVDGAITEAGGILLDQYRKSVPFTNNDVLKGIRCPIGEARITKTAGKLKCLKYVIHCVGPDYSKLLKFKKKNETKKQIFENGDQLLYECYANTMKLAQQYSCKSIAFSLVSCGIYKGQQDIKKILLISAKAIVNNLYDELESLHMVAFTQHELKMLETVLPLIWGQSSNVYLVNTNR